MCEEMKLHIMAWDDDIVILGFFFFVGKGARVRYGSIFFFTFLWLYDGFLGLGGLIRFYQARLLATLALPGWFFRVV